MRGPCVFESIVAWVMEHVRLTTATAALLFVLRTYVPSSHTGATHSNGSSPRNYTTSTGQPEGLDLRPFGLASTHIG